MMRNFTILLLLAVSSLPLAAQPAPIRLTVADAITRGFEASHRLAEVRAREQGAQAALRGAQAADKPTVTAGGGYTRTNHVQEFAVSQGGARLVIYPDIPDNFSSRLAMQWPIYTSGRVDALERAADAEARAVAADIETARADLRFEIVRAYWGAATAREAVRVLEESAARADAQLRDARQRFSVGLIPPNEVLSLEAQRSREQAQLIEASNQRESSLIELRRLIGVVDETVIELADRLDASAFALENPSELRRDGPSLIAEAREQRPERKALTLRLGGIEAREQAAMTANKPVVAVAAGVDYAKPNQRIFPRQGIWQESWDLSVNVSWPFLDFGRTKAQVAEVAAAAAATRERLAEFDSVVSADVRQRLLDLDSSLAMVKAASDAVKSATEARRVVGDRFAAGVATSTDVVVAQVAMLENELARTRALAGVRLAEARLHRVLGRP
ncbi:MAG: TolC family protein [Acidobacteriota bacterium]|nr:TolC family protein [Acidobacteriota bacterium]